MKPFIKNRSLSFCLCQNISGHKAQWKANKKRKKKNLCKLFHDSEPLNLMSNVGKSWIMPRLLFTQDALLPARF